MSFCMQASHQPIVYCYCQTRDIDGACGQLAIKSQPKSESKSTLDIEDLGGKCVTTTIKNTMLPTRMATPPPSSTKKAKISKSGQKIAHESSNTDFVLNNIPVVLLLMGGAIASLGMVVSGLKMKYRLKLNS